MSSGAGDAGSDGGGSFTEYDDLARRSPRRLSSLDAKALEIKNFQSVAENVSVW